ncbi:MAG TPA: hypothetical protein VFB03_03345 [Candidatus Saccharimonadales bacterium]|nr:hypothetical protein [Candidatus Saccharimonadales bacterium]
MESEDNSEFQPPPVVAQAQPAHVTKSHRFLFIYLVVIVVAALTGGVYAWQHHDVSSLKKQVASQNSQITKLKSDVQTLSAPLPGASNNNSPLQYKDWKTYCDTINNACFRYPKDWVITGSSSSNQATETANNATSTALAQYNDPYTTQALDQVYFIVDTKDLNKKDLGLKVVERVIGNTPDFVIVDSTYLASNHVTANKSQSFMDNAKFTSKNTRATAQFMAKPSNAALSNIKSTDQATSWFSSDDAKTCLQILQSFYYQ